jgi:hypothetical protein
MPGETHARVEQHQPAVGGRCESHPAERGADPLGLAEPVGAVGVDHRRGVGAGEFSQQLDSGQIPVDRPPLTQRPVDCRMDGSARLHG